MLRDHAPLRSEAQDPENYRHLPRHSEHGLPFSQSDKGAMLEYLSG